MLKFKTKKIVKKKKKKDLSQLWPWPWTQEQDKPKKKRRPILNKLNVEEWDWKINK
jgi:hypothetical protein